MKWKKVISFLLQNKEIDDIKPLLSTEELTRFENSNIRTALDLYLLKSIHFCILNIMSRDTDMIDYYKGRITAYMELLEKDFLKSVTTVEYHNENTIQLSREIRELVSKIKEHFNKGDEL